MKDIRGIVTTIALVCLATLGCDGGDGNRATGGADSCAAGGIGDLDGGTEDGASVTDNRGTSDGGDGDNIVSVDSATSYWPAVLGNERTYSVTHADGTVHVRITSVIESSPTEFVQKTVIDGASTFFTDTYVINDNGLGISSSMYHFAPDDTSQMPVVWTPPLLVLPANLTPGFMSSITSTTPSRATLPADERDVTVNGVEAVTVPAGTFMALKISTYSVEYGQGGSGESHFTSWYARGIGLVKSVNGPPDKPKLANTTELVSYTKN